MILKEETIKWKKKLQISLSFNNVRLFQSLDYNITFLWFNRCIFNVRKRRLTFTFLSDKNIVCICPLLPLELIYLQGQNRMLWTRINIMKCHKQINLSELWQWGSNGDSVKRSIEHAGKNRLEKRNKAILEKRFSKLSQNR